LIFNWGNATFVGPVNFVGVISQSDVFVSVGFVWDQSEVLSFEFFGGQIHELVFSHFVRRVFGVVGFNSFQVFRENSQSVGFGIVGVRFVVFSFPRLEFVIHVLGFVEEEGGGKSKEDDSGQDDVKFHLE
jgi:hypothetical protein